MAVIQLRRVCAAALLGLLWWVAGGAAAQELYGSVVGVIHDTSGAQVPGVSVQITNRALSTPQGVAARRRAWCRRRDRDI